MSAKVSSMAGVRPTHSQLEAIMHHISSPRSYLRMTSLFLGLSVCLLQLPASAADVDVNVVKTLFQFKNANVTISGGEQHFVPWLDEHGLYLKLDSHVVFTNGRKISLDGSVADLEEFKSLIVSAGDKSISVIVDGKSILSTARTGKNNEALPKGAVRSVGGSSAIVISAGGSITITASGGAVIGGQGGGVQVGGGGNTEGARISAGSVSIQSGGDIKLGSSITAGGDKTEIKGPLVNQGGTMNVGRAVIRGDEKYRHLIAFEL
ncbi:MAG: hypothetical protein O3B01_24750 [Planctomycetota bacterium]|nr:hypothetical protein [Planctomycetota bacterium]